MMVHICNPSTQEVEKENQEFKASLDYIARLYLKKEREGGGENRDLEILPSIEGGMGWKGRS
jgi:hypothetical protein